MPGELLVTGCYRSGTTLLEKLLHAHPDACVASQPFPVLYAYVKNLFDAGLGISRRYPLGHRFLEDAYGDADFEAFLDSRVLTRADVDAIFDQLASYTEGLWTPEILGSRQAIVPGRLIDLHEQLLRVMPNLLSRPDARVVGSKEILVEEYVPYLLQQGRSVILIVRDPRDMIASLNFSERDNATGAARPVLYSIRVWRKSVACALAFERHPRFRWVRYEDLIADTTGVMADLNRFLGLRERGPEAFTTPVVDQRGMEWRGNSSFRDKSGVSKESVGRYREILPGAVQRLIEAAATPEMKALGYAAPVVDADAIARYVDPFEHVHAKFPADYSADPERVRSELERLSLLTGSASLTDAEATRWFIYPAAYRRLRSAVQAR
jgi:hypothetical protein